MFTSEATNLVPTLDTQTDQDVYERSLTLNSIGVVDQVGNVRRTVRRSPRRPTTTAP